MFGIGLPELLIILAVALIVVGPEKLPQLARTLAKTMIELKKTANSLRDSIQEEVKEVKDEIKPWEQLPSGPPPAEGMSAATGGTPPPAGDSRAEPDATVPAPEEAEKNRRSSERPAADDETAP